MRGHIDMLEQTKYGRQGKKQLNQIRQVLEKMDKESVIGVHEPSASSGSGSKHELSGVEGSQVTVETEGWL